MYVSNGRFPSAGTINVGRLFHMFHDLSNQNLGASTIAVDELHEQCNAVRIGVRLLDLASISHMMAIDAES